MVPGVYRGVVGRPDRDIQTDKNIWSVTYGDGFTTDYDEQEMLKYGVLFVDGDDVTGGGLAERSLLVAAAASKARFSKGAPPLHPRARCTQSPVALCRNAVHVEASEECSHYKHEPDVAKRPPILEVL